MKSGTELNEEELNERVIHRHQNERVHSLVHRAVLQYAQFTVGQNMNVFMNYRSGPTLTTTKLWKNEPMQTSVQSRKQSKIDPVK